MTGRERRELAGLIRRVLAATDPRCDRGLRDILSAYAAGLEGVVPRA